MNLTRFKFQQINPSKAKARINHILREEGMELSKKVIETVTKISKGDMRKIINLFQNIHLHCTGDAEDSNKIKLESGIGSEWKPEDVYRLTGTLSPKKVEEIFRSLMGDDMEDSLKNVEEVFSLADANVASVLPELTEVVLKQIEGNKMKNLKIDILNILADVEKKACRDIPENLLRDYMVSQFFILRNVQAKQLKIFKQNN